MENAYRATVTEGCGKVLSQARGRVYGVCLFVLTLQLFRWANDNGDDLAAFE